MNYVIAIRRLKMGKMIVICALLTACLLIPLGNKIVASDVGYAGVDTCKGCHGEGYDSYAKTIHAKKAVKGTPANLNGCESCHGAGAGHVEKGGGKGTGVFAFGKKVDAKDKSAKCLSCHEESRHLTFWDNGRHKSAGVSCGDCHALHGNAEKMLKSSQPELCFGCHKEIRMMSNRQSHHPIKEGKMKCTDCHNPHGGFGEKMIKADSVNELCFTCHAEKRGPYRFEHQPVAENCLVCHYVHGSNHRAMLVSKPPQLCQECHGSGAHMGKAYTDQTSFKGSDPRPQMYGRACMNCHTNIHGSSAQFLR